MSTELNIKEIVKEVLLEMDREKKRRAELIKGIQQIFPKIRISSDISTDELDTFLSTLKKLGFNRENNEKIDKKESIQRTTRKIKYAIAGIALTITAAIFLVLYGLSLGVSP